MPSNKIQAADYIWAVAMLLEVHAKDAGLEKCATLLSQVVREAAQAIADAEKH